jgi:hypothetical protein
VVAENFEDISKTLGIGTARQLEKRAIKESKQANKALDQIYDVYNARGLKLDLAPAVAEIRATAKKIELPKISDDVDWDQYWKVPKEKRMAYLESQAARKALAEKVPASGYPQHLAAVTKQADDLEAINQIFEGAVPVKQARTFYQGAGQKASDLGVYKKVGGTTGAEARAAEAAQAAVSELLKKQFPGLLRDPMMKSHQWATVRNALRKVANTAESTEQVPALNVMLARYVGLKGLAAAGIGGGAAAATGGSAYAIAGGAMTAYGMFQAAREILSSPLYRSLNARGRLALIESLPGGSLAATTAIGRETMPHLREGVNGIVEGPEGER